MSNVTHSPGPWAVCETSHLGRSILGVSIDGGKSGFPIAPMPATEQDRADAALVAAAPDLLENLRNLVGLAELRGTGLHQYRAALDDARAVIAKAEGPLIAEERGTKS